MRDRLWAPLSPPRPRPAPRPVKSILRLLPLAAGLAVLSACQDPAGVGLGLIDEESPDPAVRALPATEVDAVADTRPLIGVADSSAALPQTRVLAGDVSDPVFGDARVTGYLDFTQPSVPDGTEPGDVRSVRLEVQRTYVYGDTTTALPLTLRQVDAAAGSWSPSLDYPADTVLAVGPALATATVTVSDDVVAFDLPAAWVEANAALLVGDPAAFNNDFEGFALEPTRPGGAGAVFGFQAQTSRTRLRVFTASDTLSYPVGEVFSSVQRGPAPPAPPGFVAAQAGAGRAVGLRFDLGALGPVALARAVLRVPIDASVAQDGAFVRPLARRAQLFGVDDATGERTPIALVAVEGGVATTLQSEVLRAFLQEGLIGTRRLDRFELVPTPVPAASLDVLPVLRPGGAEGPRLSLTVVGG